MLSQNFKSLKKTAWLYQVQKPGKLNKTLFSNANACGKTIKAGKRITRAKFSDYLGGREEPL